MTKQLLSDSDGIRWAKENVFEQLFALLRALSFGLFLDKREVPREYYIVQNEKTVHASFIYGKKNWERFLKETGRYPLSGHMTTVNQDALAKAYYEWLTQQRTMKSGKNMYAYPENIEFNRWLKRVIQCVIFIRCGEAKVEQDTSQTSTFVNMQSKELVGILETIIQGQPKRYEKNGAKYKRLIAQQPWDTEALIKKREAMRKVILYDDIKAMDEAINAYPMVKQVIPPSLLPFNLLPMLESGEE